MTSIRKEIANRILYEIKRRNISANQVCNLIKISDEIIKGYLSEKREINFSEITRICNGFGINPVRFIYSEEYPTPKLAFRNVDFNIQKFASEIEDIFLSIEDFLPTINIPKMTRISNKSYERADIISEAAAFASKIQLKYGTPENFISNFSIPVLPIKNSHVEFDAFIINNNKHVAICINISKPPQRIRFSLAHEIAHLLFDIDTEVQIDIFLPNLYWKSRIDENEVPEFFAYKFAEFYLLPYEKIYNISKTVPKLNLRECQTIIDNYRTSKDVLANALFDVISVNKNFQNEEFVYQPSGEQFRRMDWEEKQDIKRCSYGRTYIKFNEIKTLLNGLKNSSEATKVFSFLEDCKKNITKIIESSKEHISDNVRLHIAEVLKLDF